MIILKKQFDEVLKEYKLNNLTLSRIEKTGGILELITTECERPIIEIRGIKIPHTKLNMEERGIILSQLTAYIKKNSKSIKEVFDITINPIKLKKYPGYSVSAHYSNYTYGNGNSARQISVSIEVMSKGNNNFTLYYVKGGKYSIHINTEITDEFSSLIEKISEMKTIAAECMKTQMLIDKQQENLTKLKSCRI